MRKNINVGILYLEAWLRGFGAVALYNLMEDAATAEISRTQLWQWLKNKAFFDDGRQFDYDLFDTIFDEEIEKIIIEIGESKIRSTKFAEAIKLFRNLVTQQDFEEFLTLSAYQQL